MRTRWTAEARAARCGTIAELRAMAKRTVPKPIFDYADGAAWDEVTARRNRTAFEDVTLHPKALTDVSAVDLRTTVLGGEIALPIIAAPTGLTGLQHPEGEIAVARAAHAAGTLTTLSTMASCTLEEVAEASPGRRWFQLYVQSDRGLVDSLLERARANGYEALMLTVDVQVAGVRERDVRNGFSIPPRITLKTLAPGPHAPALERRLRRQPADGPRQPRLVGAARARRSSPRSTACSTRRSPGTTSPTCARAGTGPLIIKGVMRADDAVRCVEHGADAIVVSNHGGRQLDGAAASIEALPAIADAVGDRCEIYLDSGIRRGTDIVKALALGARAVLIGRALMYGLGAAGEAGARRAFAILEDELRIALALAGYPRAADLGRRRES